ncbi:hypothetical protein IIA95_00160 [Patescibacteria group bacterium]|nr:hypothetical protein [Patescibacteria group bacterium]
MSEKNKTKKKLLVILDAHAILHRAYHALPSFTSPKGESTGALYGFSSMLLRIIREFKPDYIVAAYDLAEPTFRHIAYEKYKAKRPKVEEELISQFDRSREILKFFHIPVYEKAGFEADDVIGTVVEKNKKEKNIDIMIASGDLDTLQLVSGKKVQVYTLRKGSEEAIYDEKAVLDRFGFGPELLPDFKGLQGDPSDNIPGVRGIGEKTAKELIKKFGTLENILKLAKENPEKLKASGIKERIINLLVEGEEEALFSKILGLIRRDAPISFHVKEAQWKSFDREKLEAFFRELGFFSLLSRLPDGGEGAKSSFKEKIDPKLEKKLSVAAWLLDSRRINITPEEVFHITNTKTTKEAFAWLESELKKEGLKTFFDDIELPLIDILDEMQRTGILIDIPLLKKLSKKYEEEISTLEKKIWKLAGTEFTMNSPKQLSEVLYNRLKINVKGIRKTGTGARSTSFPELKKLKGAHPIIEFIIQYRELAKLKSTYIDALPVLADGASRLHTTFNQAGTVTGRFSSQNPNLQNIPIRTELGRGVRRAFIAPPGHLLLSADYSQIELRIAAILSGDKIMKEAFLKGKDIHQATAAQIFNVEPEKVTSEMRRVAKTINFGILYGMGVRALAENLEISLDEARRFYDEYFQDFSGIKKYIEETKERAQKDGVTKTLFGRRRHFPELQALPEYLRHDYLRMAVNAPIQGTAADIMKMAMIRVYRAIQKDKELAGTIKMVLQIHDELLFEVKKDALEKAARIIKKEMEAVYKNDIPLIVDIRTGANWTDLKGLEIKN